MIPDKLIWRFGLALAAPVLATSIATAADSFSNTLTGFTGNSALPATQAAVNQAGFNFFDHQLVSKVDFNSSGATFGDTLVDNDDVDRNYMRTNDSDYANVSFVAEITMVTAPLTPPGCIPPACGIDVQDGYFGVGSGDANIDFFRVPDFGTQNASVVYWGENEVATPTIELYAINNATNADVVLVDPAPGLVDGTHRVRLTYDWFRKTAEFAFDFNYAGGINDTFVADVTAPALNVFPLYTAGGFPDEPARIWFGGDERITFKDFEVNVSTPEMLMGDFNSSGTVTEADWIILRTNLHANLNGLTNEEAYFRGDLTADLASNHADFVAFKTIYDETHGSGSFVRMVAGVPEPSTLCLLLSTGLIVAPFRRRVVRS